MLRRDLSDTPMRYPCPHCGAKMGRPGRPLARVCFVRCTGCNAHVSFGYDATCTLFEAARLTHDEADDARAKRRTATGGRWALKPALSFAAVWSSYLRGIVP